MTPELLRALPKTDLHCHLDGSLRLATLVELADADGVALPAREIEALAARLHVGMVCESLEHYLEAFSVTLSVLQTAEGLRRVARELVEDAGAEGVWLLEVRFSPVLHEERGLSREAALEAVLAGLSEGRARTGVAVGAIVCGLRHIAPAVNEELAALAVRYRGRGVVAFDLAGGEASSPTRANARAFAIARAGDLPVTVHAGEALGAESIREAVHLCGADRIGHGTRLFEDPSLLEWINDHRIALEVCPSSNEQTRAVESVARHPMAEYLRRGLRVTINTDNRLMSGTTSSRELERVARELGLERGLLRAAILNGFEAAFVPRAEKLAWIARAGAELDRLLPGG